MASHVKKVKKNMSDTASSMTLSKILSMTLLMTLSMTSSMTLSMTSSMTSSMILSMTLSMTSSMILSMTSSMTLSVARLLALIFRVPKSQLSRRDRMENDQTALLLTTFENSKDALSEMKLDRTLLLCHTSP